MHRDKHLRRIAHLAEPFACHLEDCKLRGGTETVLYAAQKTVCPSVVSLELKNHIHYMFKDLRAGNASFLGYMAYKYDRHSGLLCKTEQHGGGFLYLGH